MKTHVASRTHPGRVRSENQDRLGRFPTRYGEAFVVADGMGGLAHGGTAADLVIGGLETHLADIEGHASSRAAIRQAIVEVHNDIERAAAAIGTGTMMGATAVMALLSKTHVTVAHVGDSRAYLLRNGGLSRLTKDHSVVQKMVDCGILTESEARVHPDANVVLRALGLPDAHEPEISDPLPLCEGDSILLCSDGLCRSLDDRRIEQLLRESNRDGARWIAFRLLEESIAAGAEDNVTFQLLQFGPNES